MSRYRDFDAEAEDKKLTFKLGDHTYTTTGDPDARKMLPLIAEGALGIDGSLRDPSRVGDLFSAMLGDEQWTALQERGVGMLQLNALSEWILQKTGIAPDPEATPCPMCNGTGAAPEPEEDDAEGEASRSPMPSSIGEQ